MTQQAWQPSIKINSSIAKQSIEETIPEFGEVSSIEQIDSGWDNTVFLVNQSFIFRFPHREESVALIQRENIILTAIQTQIDLAVPNPIYQSSGSSRFAYPFHGYKKLDGISGCHAQLTLIDRKKSIIPLAKFLKKLHEIDAEQARSIGAQAQYFDRSYFMASLPELDKRYDKLCDLQFVNSDKTVYQSEKSLIQNISLPQNKFCLVHGDMYCRHLLFLNGKLNGIIDWGDAGINHPAIDFMVLYSFYPKESHAKFFQIYGNVDPDTKKVARFLGLYSSITILLYAHDIGDEKLVKEARESILRINPDLVI